MMTATFSPSREMLDAVDDWRQRRADARIADPIVALLIRRFSLSPLQACAVIRAANAKEARDATAS